MVAMAATDTLLVMAAREVATDVMAVTAVGADALGVFVPVALAAMDVPAVTVAPDAAAGSFINLRWFTVVAAAAAAA
jgi:hypothetical protein